MTLRKATPTTLLLLLCLAATALGGPPLQEDALLIETLKAFQQLRPPRARRSRDEAMRSAAEFPVAEMDQFIQATMRCPSNRIPGAAVVVTTGSATLYANAFGVRSLSTPELPVDEHTLFGIGSISKSFTTAMLATLVDEGKLDFEHEVREYLPSFNIQGVGADRATIRDLTCHRTGLPRGDLAWNTQGVPNQTRAGAIRALYALPPVLAFRYASDYNNWMFATAGHVAETVTGQQWEQLVKQRLFDPLGMVNTTTSVLDAINRGNYAAPHGFKANGSVVPYPEDVNTILDLICPAGCISASVRDMEKWLRLQLNLGTIDGKTIVSKNSLGMTLKPSEVFVAMALFAPGFQAPLYVSDYGLGWFTGTYRGHYITAHGGNTIGHSGLQLALPNDGVAVAVLTNQDQQGLSLYAIALQAVDYALGYTPWITNPCTFPNPPPTPTTTDAGRQPPKTAGPVPVADPAEYASAYSHPMFGTVRVTATANGLQAQWGNTNGALTATGKADNFIGQFSAPWALDPVDLPVQFERNVTGSVAVLLLPIEQALPPIPFTAPGYTPQLPAYPEHLPVGTSIPN